MLAWASAPGLHPKRLEHVLFGCSPVIETDLSFGNQVMDPIRFFRNRLIQLIPVLLGVSILVFLMLRLIPGDPARIMLGTRATDERIAALHTEMGLDRPVWEQYFLFLGNALRGDLGTSIFARRPVVEVLSERMPVTLLLVAYAITIVPDNHAAHGDGGGAAARPPGGLYNSRRMIIGLALPSFWLGLMLILVFSVQLKWFPISGVGTMPISWLWHLFLPALTLAVPVAAMLIRNLRSSVIDVLNAPYVEFARAKGLKSQAVLGKHVLRNAFISVVTILGLNIGWLVGGSVVVETIFTIPGMGSLAVTAVYARDYPMVQGITLLFGFSGDSD